MLPIYEDEKYLSSEEDIISYFEDVGLDVMDCGQGYFTNEYQVYCKIGEQYYLVELEAEIGSAKQDRGDRLYWVENVSVEYSKVEPPEPPETKHYSYEIELTEEQKVILDQLLDSHNIKHFFTKKDL